MRCLAVFAAIVVAAPSFVQAQIGTVPKPADISKDSTHEQVSLIKATEGASSLKLNTFCLDKKGRILAGCNAGRRTNGAGKGVIRVFDTDGDFLTSWNVSVDPEAINVAPDGTVLVAGNGKLFRYTAEGKRLHDAAAPHYEKLKTGGDEIRKQVVEQMKNQAKIYDNVIKSYTQQLERLSKKEKLTAVETRQKKAYELNLKTFKRIRDQISKRPEPSKKDIDARVASMIRSKTGISSISSDGKNIYVATRALKGYGFAIWKTDTKFGNAKQIVSNLRGCCGQMDVQANKGGVYVAENSRHRVVCFNNSGKELRAWGKGDRKGVEGFSSCCNPMNVCFSGNGDVYTAESNTGRIKRFSPQGKFLAYVGDVKLVPGCKKVSIAVSKNADRVYMLDITRNHIIVMQRKSALKTTAGK